ncbi:MAG: hypothetical protein NT022_11295, partial [Deltaproteobacteria bacterium]|nr:hypothetical protein [Deltaproteobacteria bacterium]
TLSGLSASYAREVIILKPVPAEIPVSVQRITEESNFSLEILQANGAALTCLADVYGYLY